MKDIFIFPTEDITKITPSREKVLTLQNQFKFRKKIIILIPDKF